MVAFATSAAAGNNRLSPVPNTGFTDEEYNKLFALQLDGYEDMTVSEFRTQIFELIDTVEYRELLERFSQDQTLYDMKDNNETASFLFNVLEPLIAERWQERDFGGYATTNYVASDNATLEYQLTMTILDADTLTVREYNDARPCQRFYRECLWKNSKGIRRRRFNQKLRALPRRTALNVCNFPFNFGLCRFLAM